MWKRFAQLHPLTRLNLLALIILLSMQICIVVSIIFLVPSTLSPLLAQAVLLVPTLWCLVAVAVTLFLFWNAYRLYIRYQQRYQYTTPTNLALAGMAPVMLFTMVCVWVPMITAVFEIRLNWDFSRSRDEMVAICDEILEEGIESDKIDDDADVGRYSRVNIRLEDGYVWFDIGDETRSVGYLCRAKGADAPQENDEYEFSKKDDRFYLFQQKQDEEDDDDNDNNEQQDEEQQRIFG